MSQNILKDFNDILPVFLNSFVVAITVCPEVHEWLGGQDLHHCHVTGGRKAIQRKCARGSLAESFSTQPGQFFWLQLLNSFKLTSSVFQKNFPSQLLQL